MSGVHRLRAPAGDGEVLAEPPLPEVGPLLTENTDRLSRAGEILGQPLHEFRVAARKEVLELARAYLAEVGEPVPDLAAGGLMMAGHQPELFHPGVWVKNFALNGLARRHGRIPLNLIVDNDIAKSATLRMPRWDREPANVHLAMVPFDHFAGEAPYEDRPVLDPDLFRTFPDRAAAATRTWHFKPMLRGFWDEVSAQQDDGRTMGERFAAARRSVERRWGCHNLEVKLSRLCQTRSFATFAKHLLTHLPRFQAIYNECLAEYRDRHGIHSRSHPVPDLAREGEWYEAPFWAWRGGDPRRGRLMAKVNPVTRWADLRVGSEVVAGLALDDRVAFLVGYEWSHMALRGWRIRSRALTTTLFARLCLADLFIHGLGGGKYDELTDDIIRRFFGIEPPHYLTLTATLRLPLPTFPTGPDQYRREARAARDLHWNPQRHPPADARTDPRWSELVAEKLALMASEPENSAGRRERFHRLQAVTNLLRPFVAAEEETARRKLEAESRDLHANAILRRRDYAFCLFPEDVIRPFCTQFL